MYSKQCTQGKKVRLVNIIVAFFSLPKYDDIIQGPSAVPINDAL